MLKVKYDVYKLVHLYDHLVGEGPPNVRYNRSQSGWLDETTDWFFKMMLPKLRCLEGRKVLIGDNLSSHLSDAIIKACSQNNIAFVCLYPNVTHLLQPLDVTWFAPHKKVWRKTLEDRKRSPQGLRFPSKRAFQQVIENSSIQIWGIWCFFRKLSGFLKCGLYPLNPNVVYEKFPSENVMSPRKALNQSLLQQRQRMRESPVGENA